MTTLVQNRSFLSLWISQMLSQTAAHLTIFSLAIVMREQTLSNLYVSLLMISFGLPSFLFGALAGVFVDKMDKRAVLAFTNLTRFLIVILFLLVRYPLPAIFALAFCMALLTQFFIPAEGSLIPRIVSKKELISANSLFTFTLYSSIALGSFAGLSLGILGVEKAFGFYALLFLLASLLILFVREADEPALVGRLRFLKDRLLTLFGFKNHEIISPVPWGGFFLGFFDHFESFGAVLEELKKGFDFVRKSKEVFTAIILLGSIQILIASLLTLGPGFVDEVLKIPVRVGTSVVMVPALLGMVSGALFLAKFGTALDRDRFITLAVFGLGLNLSSLYFSPILPITLILFNIYVMGILGAFVAVPSITNLQSSSPHGFRGRVYGILVTSVALGAALPVIFAGIFADIFGVEAVLLGLGVVMVGVGLLIARSLK